MKNDTIPQTVLFPDLFEKPLVATFDQQHASSDSGAILLKAADARYGVTDGFARCLVDERQPGKIRHALEDLLGQALIRRRLPALRTLPSSTVQRYHAPETPCARLLASDAITPPMKDRLRALLGTLDPLRLLDEIRTVQHHLAGLAAGESVHALPHRDADLDRFLKSLAHAWREGEVRPTHRTGPKPRRYWRRRRDPFETTWPRIVTWLETEPERTAKELFDRLRAEHPGGMARWMGWRSSRTLHAASVSERTAIDLVVRFISTATHRGR